MVGSQTPVQGARNPGQLWTLQGRGSSQSPDAASTGRFRAPAEAGAGMGSGVGVTQELSRAASLTCAPTKGYQHML